eukprot:c8269_g1_i1 orf=1-240(-)
MVTHFTMSPAICAAVGSVSGNKSHYWSERSGCIFLGIGTKKSHISHNVVHFKPCAVNFFSLISLENILLFYKHCNNCSFL